MIVFNTPSITKLSMTSQTPDGKLRIESLQLFAMMRVATWTFHKSLHVTLNSITATHITCFPLWFSLCNFHDVVPDVAAALFSPDTSAPKVLLFSLTRPAPVAGALLEPRLDLSHGFGHRSRFATWPSDWNKQSQGKGMRHTSLGLSGTLAADPSHPASRRCSKSD